MKMIYILYKNGMPLQAFNSEDLAEDMKIVLMVRDIRLGLASSYDVRSLPIEG